MQIVRPKQPLAKVVYALAPSSCLRCGALGSDLCEACRPFALIAKAASCFNCNALSEEFETCRRCRISTSLSRVYVASHYEGVVKDLITRLKYHYAVDNGKIIGNMLSEHIAGEYDAVVAVPTSAKRYRQRGFNPSLQIAKTVAANTETPRVNALYRVGNTQQVGSDRGHRLSQLNGMIGVRRSKTSHLIGMRILLIDDVMTTGATLNECAKVLKQTGVKSVEAAVLAKH